MSYIQFSGFARCLPYPTPLSYFNRVEPIIFASEIRVHLDWIKSEIDRRIASISHQNYTSSDVGTADDDNNNNNIHISQVLCIW